MESEYREVGQNWIKESTYETSSVNRKGPAQI